MNPINVKAPQDPNDRSAWKNLEAHIKAKQKSGEQIKIVRISSHEIVKPVNPPNVTIPPPKQETPKYGVVNVNSPLDSSITAEAIVDLDDENSEDAQEIGSLMYEQESKLASMIRGINAFNHSVIKIEDNKVTVYWPPSLDNVVLEGEKPKKILAIFNPEARTGRVNPRYHNDSSIVDGFGTLKDHYLKLAGSKLAIIIDPNIEEEGS